ncbi:MAG: hypothetical protein AAF939_02355 [Planctomycetota bacterium]
MKNKEQLSLNLEGTPPTGMIESDVGVDLFEVMAALRPECEPPASGEERALKDSVVEAAATDELMEQIVDTANLDRA